MGNLLLYLALGLVLLGTTRLARAKARNPWLWVGAALLLMLIPGLHLLAVIPMIVLMFMKSPQHRGRTSMASSACPKCRTPSLRRSRFCTKCGWELGVEYSPENLAEHYSSLSVPATENRAPAHVSGAPGQQPDDEGTKGPAGSPPQEAPAPETSLPKKPVSLGVPTAASMTERGVRLFNQARIQESIDQFTKAIALDSNYTQAWARRAEAYARLGRGAEAAEDRRKLEALNTSSSGA